MITIRGENELRRLTVVMISGLSFLRGRLYAHVCIQLPIPNNSESNKKNRVGYVELQWAQFGISIYS